MREGDSRKSALSEEGAAQRLLLRVSDQEMYSQHGVG